MKTTRIIQLIFLLLCGCFLQVNAEERTVTFDATVDKAADAGATSFMKEGVILRVNMSGDLKTNDYYYLGSGDRLYITTPGTVTQIIFTSTVTGNTKYGLNPLDYEGTGCTSFVDKSDQLIKTWIGSCSGEMSFYANGSPIHITKIEITYSTAKQFPLISFDTGRLSYKALSEIDFTEPTLANPYNLPVTYTSSNTDVVDVDAASGNIIYGSESGTVTITASTAETETYAAGAVSYQLKFVVIDPSNKFYLVTDATTLHDGDIVVITNTTQDKAMGEQRTNNRDAIAIDAIDDNTIHINNLVSTLTLHESSGKWTFQDGTKYLYASGSDKDNGNYLNVKSSADAYAKATITITTDGTATIKFGTKNKRDLLCYNTSYDIFSCYTSGQSPVQIYRKPTETVSLTMSAVGYATLYYSDKNLIVPEGLQAKTYYVEDGRVLYESKTYQPGDIIPGGTGVILKGSAGDYELEVTSETGTTDSNNALRGSDTTATTTGGTVYYKLAVDPDNGAVGFYWGSENGAAFVNQAHRAYLATSASAANSCFIFDDAVSAINAVTMSTADDHHIYNLNGQRIDATQQLPRGIYIKDGKKRLTR